MEYSWSLAGSVPGFSCTRYFGMVTYSGMLLQCAPSSCSCSTLMKFTICRERSSEALVALLVTLSPFTLLLVHLLASFAFGLGVTKANAMSYICLLKCYVCFCKQPTLNSKSLILLLSWHVSCSYEGNMLLCHAAHAPHIVYGKELLHEPASLFAWVLQYPPIVSCCLIFITNVVTWSGLSSFCF